jgi:hydroxymethylpyrimidine pyrophosphatase-like HAD family hydrolase
MGSAPKEIKQRASFVTKSAMNNGVSWALKHYPL